MSINYVIELGRIASDYNKRMVKWEKGEFAAVDFSMAINEYKKGEVQTSFVRCEATGGVAENLIKYFQKGDLLLVKGRLNQRKFNRKDGEFGEVVSIKVEEIGFIPSICPHCGKRLVKAQEIKEPEQLNPPMDSKDSCDAPF